MTKSRNKVIGLKDYLRIGCDKARVTMVVGPKSDDSPQERRSSLGKRSRGCALELDYTGCEHLRLAP